VGEFIRTTEAENSFERQKKKKIRNPIENVIIEIVLIEINNKYYCSNVFLYQKLKFKVSSLQFMPILYGFSTPHLPLTV
jgi:hypothetical protein